MNIITTYNRWPNLSSAQMSDTHFLRTFLFRFHSSPVWCRFSMFLV